MMKNFASEKTPTTSVNWINLSEAKRKELVNDELKKNENLNDFEVYQTFDDGQIVFKVKKTISSNIRGVLLIDLEEILKKNIDTGLTVWFEPIGDKSKLRNLRGIKIKPDNN
jgi:hypothetical protein